MATRSSPVQGEPDTKRPIAGPRLILSGGYLAQAKRDAKRPISKPPEVVVSLPIEQWRKLLGEPVDGPAEVVVSLTITRWRKLLGRMSIQEFAARLPLHDDGKHWSASYISRVETGTRGGSEELREAIRKFIATETLSN